jgi:hypothetical protein
MNTNPLLHNLQIPGEVFALPSKGLFYKNGELADNVVDGEVMVYPMSAFEEITIRNISSIINGHTLADVFGRCVPQILKPNELFGQDVDLLLLALRKVTYGNTIDIKYNHNCGTVEKPSLDHEYEIHFDVLIDTTTGVDAAEINNQYNVIVDNGSVVELTPLKYYDIIDIMKDSKDFDTQDITAIKMKIVQAALRVIRAVDGIEDKAHIEEWCRAIPVGWYNKIMDKLTSHNKWGTPNTYHTKCIDCDQPIIIEVPNNPLTFFLV